jgi:hypothetical protein
VATAFAIHFLIQVQAQPRLAASSALAFEMLEIILAPAQLLAQSERERANPYA